MNLRTQNHSLQKHIKQRNHELYTMESEYLTNLWFIKITPCQKLKFTDSLPTIFTTGNKRQSFCSALTHQNKLIKISQTAASCGHAIIRSSKLHAEAFRVSLWSDPLCGLSEIQLHATQTCTDMMLEKLILRIRSKKSHRLDQLATYAEQ